MDIFQNQNSFCTIKDHKPDFPARIDVRLINPAKSNLGLVSKKILDKVNTAIRRKINSNQWRSTGDVLEWFDGIQEKNKHNFFQWDIVSFYPSITEKLFDTLLIFARKYIQISKEEENILRNARKQILCWNRKTWTKANGNLFDVPMGSYDGAELCELAGLYCLFMMKLKLPHENFGLYRDDGLGVTTKSGPAMSRIEKTLHQIFKGMGLKITTTINVKRVEFLDAILDLSNGTRGPYRKPLDTPVYVNANSSHPAPVIKQIPRSVQDRLSTLSSTENEFDLAAPPYREALKKAGYKENLKFEKPVHTEKKNRSRKCIWFNPPHSMAVETNITKLFAEIINKSFPKDHPYLSKLFNKNNMKLSYSCKQNISAIIASHNKKLLSSRLDQAPVKTCNCNLNAVCPLGEKCLAEEIVYEAKVVSSDQEVKFYTGATETDFKKRYNNHTKSFRLERYKHETTLSSYIWKLKEKQLDYNITWRIVRNTKAYSSTAGKCCLCLEEKKEILKNYRNTKYLNKRNELFSKCRHRKKWLLSSVK